MSWTRTGGILLVALSLAACDAADPTEVRSPDQATEFARGAGAADAHARSAGLLTDVPVEFNGTEGWLTVTRFERAEDGSLTVDGLLRWEEDGETLTEVFSDAPATLTRSGANGDLGIQQRGTNEEGVCDILFLDIGPIFLDLLGLTVDLSPIQLDVDAEPGSGNLLGNLLCAVVGLLDDGPVAAIENLLDQVNAVLDAATGLLENLPVTGELEDGGIFEGTLTLTDLALDEAGNLVASGTLEGAVRLADGTLQGVTQSFSNVMIGLAESLDALATNGFTTMQRSPNEEGTCDILFLEVGPIFLDLLGLTVDLSEIVLDIDAERGEGNLLGNLLCAVVGLLDQDPLDLDALNNLLDRISNLLA